jgi:hypothetical protein
MISTKCCIECASPFRAKIVLYKINVNINYFLECYVWYHMELDLKSCCNHSMSRTIKKVSKKRGWNKDKVWMQIGSFLRDPGHHVSFKHVGRI